MSSTKKRVFAGLIGLGYAVLYGFWTILVTGGGHGNLVWFFMFVFVYLFGIYFPLMSVLAVDLSSRFIKIAFGALILATIFGTSMFFYGWAFSDSETTSDFQAMWGSYAGTILICGIVHFFPNLIFIGILVRSVLMPSAEIDSEAPISLHLT